MPEVAIYAPGTPMWVDLASPDVEVAKRFYSGLFGWEAHTFPEPEAGGYTMFNLRGQPVAGVGPIQMPEQPAAWSTYVATEDIKATADKVRSAGGTVIVEPMKVMDAGWMAVFQDPTGAFVCAWQSGTHSGSGIVNEPGTLCWNELQTRDVPKAKSFYASVFGWNAHEAGSDEMQYTEYKLGDKTIAGMMHMADQIPAEVPPHWLSYFAVADTDAIVAKVTELGGRVLMPARDIPQGRFAVVADPSGAAFGVIKNKG